MTRGTSSERRRPRLRNLVGIAVLAVSVMAVIAPPAQAQVTIESYQGERCFSFSNPNGTKSLRVCAMVNAHDFLAKVEPVIQWDQEVGNVYQILVIEDSLMRNPGPVTLINYQPNNLWAVNGSGEDSPAGWWNCGAETSHIYTKVRFDIIWNSAGSHTGTKNFNSYETNDSCP